MKDIMIDLETLGTRSTSAIVQIGACYFDRETGEIGEVFKVNCFHRDNDKFTIDFGTINWWLDQSEEARQSLLEEGSMEIKEAMTILAGWLGDGKFLWSHATFDIPILQNAFEKCGVQNPIHYVGMRDIRTLMDLANHRGTKEREGTHHDALDDCKFQVGYCVEALNKLKN